MKNIRKRLAVLLAGMILLMYCAIPAFALEVVDVNRTGSIRVSLYDTETSEAVGGGELILYRVANVKKSNADLSFVYTNGFEDCGIELGDLSESDLAAQLVEKLSDTAESTIRTVSEDGVAEFDDLPVGLYLIVQEQTAEHYSPIRPFIVTVPIEENGHYVYEVDALPKVGTSTYTPPETPPDTPDTPDKPETPETPDTPETPETPETPDEDIPNRPDAPGPDNPNGWVMGAHGDYPEGTVEGEGPTAPNPQFPGSQVLGAHGLPQTGQLNWPIPVLTVAGIVLVLAGVVLKKEPRKHEK